MIKSFIHKKNRSFSSERFGLPHLDIDIVPGTVTLIYPDVYSIDHINLLRIIASSNKSNLVLISKEPVDLFESNIEAKDMLIAWKYKDLMTKPLLNLNKCTKFQNDPFESLRTKFNSVITIFYKVDVYELRKICRSNNNTAFVAALDMDYIYFDNVLKIKSLVFENLDYHGLIEIKKSRNFKSLRVEKMKSRIYGFKINKNGVLIEHLGIPPEEDPKR